MSNALRAGDATHLAPDKGTINLLLYCSEPLGTEAALEALALASEAKALAVLESGVKSRQSGAPATGTGTDYLAVAWPHTPGARAEYAGKHTSVGAAIGRAAYVAVTAGIRQWKDEMGL
jgi:adenosylcobinamide amidohydrolase